MRQQFDEARRVTIRTHEGDLPDLSNYGDSVAIDTETMGLKPGGEEEALLERLAFERKSESGGFWRTIGRRIID